MKKKILIVLLILVFVYCIGGVIYSIVINQISNKSEENKNILSIKNYNYQINKENVTSIYKNEFQTLKNNLESSEIDYKSYASSIAKLYIIDLYTLNIKSNKYDITSSQYVYTSAQENYKLKVSETIYKFIEESRVERNLPEVSEVFIDKIEESTYLLEKEEYESYIVTLNWKYKKDLGYDNDAILTLIKKDNIISVIEEKRVEKNS